MTDTTYTPKHPYLLRAFHEWLEDNQLTPHLMINAHHDDIIAPTEYAHDGKLVLNISYDATKDLLIDNDAISFSARFGGISKDIWLPMVAVLALYAKEDPSQIIVFDPSEYANLDTSANRDTPKSKSLSAKSDTPKNTNSKLKIIK